MEMEGLRQQQLLAIIPRHHKRYVLPSKELCHFARTSICTLQILDIGQHFLCCIVIDKAYMLAPPFCFMLL